VDELRFVPVPNPTTRADGLLSGQFYFADLTPESYARLANQTIVRQGLVDSPNTSNMIFNTKAGVLSDVRLRRAVRLAIGGCVRRSAAMAPRRLDLSEGYGLV
jgi:peptide/nickel transport system substrate-binding protein